MRTLLNSLLKLFKGKTLIEERNDLALENCSGLVLDIGCGESNYIGKHYNNSVTCDVWNLKGDGTLPFADRSFDSVTMVATLNYLDDIVKEEYFESVRRVLRTNGVFIVTVTNRLGGFLKKLLAFDGEKDSGMSVEQVLRLASFYGFAVIKVRKFNFGLNNLFVFMKIRR
jgi:SAM-dependent methyltransferase